MSVASLGTDSFRWPRHTSMTAELTKNRPNCQMYHKNIRRNLIL